MKIIAEREHYSLYRTASASPSWSGVPVSSIRYAMASGMVVISTMRAWRSLCVSRARFPKGKDADVSPTLLGDGATYSNTSDEPEHAWLAATRGCAEDNSHSRVLSGRWPSGSVQSPSTQ
jgi:hypothetical protein